MCRTFGIVGLWLLLICGAAPAWSQTEKPNKGFKSRAIPVASGDERASQTNLWVLEVHFKSLRKIQLDLPDPKTGERRKEDIWYLVYKVLQRDLGQKKDASDTDPKNRFDSDVALPLFVPEITLITHDTGQKLYDDVLIPEAQKAIMIRERLKLKNSVEIVGPIPPLTPAEADEPALFGVAIWRDVDPEADFHTIVMSGFSNGYKLVRGPAKYSDLVDRVKARKLTFSDQIWDGKGSWTAASEVYNLFDERKSPPSNPDDQLWFYTITPERIVDDEEKPIVWRKTLIQRYWRPGDGIDPQEVEFREQGDPEWIFQPDDQRVPVVKGPARPVNPKAKKEAAAP